MQRRNTWHDNDSGYLYNVGAGKKQMVKRIAVLLFGLFALLLSSSCGSRFILHPGGDTSPNVAILLKEMGASIDYVDGYTSVRLRFYQSPIIELAAGPHVVQYHFSSALGAYHIGYTQFTTVAECNSVSVQFYALPGHIFLVKWNIIDKNHEKICQYSIIDITDQVRLGTVTHEFPKIAIRGDFDERPGELKKLLNEIIDRRQ
jgi:hypothetical protein